MTLFVLGSVALEIAPLNATGMSSDGEYPFAEHQVLGAAPVYDAMGEGSRTRTFKGVTFPEHDGFTGGDTAIETLEQARRSGSPQHLMRGDGLVFGWFLISSLSQTHESFAYNGRPHQVTFEVKLTQCDAPGIGDALSIFGAFF